MKYIPIIFTALFLIYLSFIAQPIMVNDSIGYEELGHKMQHKGLLGYLQNAPQREPVYPTMIATSMTLADATGMDYLQIQKWMQVVLLVLTQVLVMILLKRLGIEGWLSTMIILCVGLMPTMINSTLWIYSEVGVYPLVIILMLLCGQAFTKAADGFNKRFAGLAIATGLCAVLLTLSKAVFELIVPVLLAVFLLTAHGMYWNARRRTQGIALLLFAVIMACSYYVPIQGYKWLNYKENGSFVLTDRGPWALYGYTLRRLEPLNHDRFAAMIAFIPGPEFCAKVMAPEKCAWWSIYPADAYGLNKLSILQAQHIKAEIIDHEMMRLSKHQIFAHPIQFLSLLFIESFKSLFWFNDYNSQVAYPDWLDSIYRHKDVFMVISFIVAFLTFVAYVHLFKTVVQRLLCREDMLQMRPALELFLLVFISIYITAYALVQVTPRYVLPIVSLDLVMIALWIESLTCPRFPSKM